MKKRYRKKKQKTCERCVELFYPDTPNAHRCEACQQVPLSVDAMAFLQTHSPFHTCLGIDVEWVEEHILKRLRQDNPPDMVLQDQNGGGERGLAIGVFRSAVAELVDKSRKQPGMSRARVESALRLCGDVAAAAKMLEVRPESLRRRCKDFGVSVS